MLCYIVAADTRTGEEDELPEPRHFADIAAPARVVWQYQTTQAGLDRWWGARTTANSGSPDTCVPGQVILLEKREHGRNFKCSLAFDAIDNENLTAVARGEIALGLGLSLRWRYTIACHSTGDDSCRLQYDEVDFSPSSGPLVRFLKGTLKEAEEKMGNNIRDIKELAEAGAAIPAGRA